MLQHQLIYIASSTPSYRPIRILFQTWTDSQIIHCLRTLYLELQSAELLERTPPPATLTVSALTPDTVTVSALTPDNLLPYWPPLL